VQLAPIKPTLKAPGTKRLKLKCDVLLSTAAFNFSLRRYTGGRYRDIGEEVTKAGAYTRPLFGST
jgi:hypothetical protein